MEDTQDAPATVLAAELCLQCSMVFQKMMDILRSELVFKRASQKR